MDKVKLFLFDNGIAVPKAEQTDEKLTDIAINLIEHDGVHVPIKLKSWYESHRKFDIHVNNTDILGEITNNMKLKDLEQFCKTNTQYQQYCGTLLSKKVLDETGIYLLEQPKTYKEWVTMYYRAKIAVHKTESLINLLQHEKENSTHYSPWLFLLISDKNMEQYKLLKKYPKYDVYNNNLKEPRKYAGFNILLNVDTKILTYKYIGNDANSIKSYTVYDVDIYDVLYRYFYFYPDWHIEDMNDLFYDKKILQELLPTLQGDKHQIALQRIAYLE